MLIQYLETAFNSLSIHYIQLMTSLCIMTKNRGQPHSANAHTEQPTLYVLIIHPQTADLMQWFCKVTHSLNVCTDSPPLFFLNQWKTWIGIHFKKEVSSQWHIIGSFTSCLSASLIDAHRALCYHYQTISVHWKLIQKSYRDIRRVGTITVRWIISSKKQISITSIAPSLFPIARAHRKPTSPLPLFLNLVCGPLQLRAILYSHSDVWLSKLFIFCTSIP